MDEVQDRVEVVVAHIEHRSPWRELHAVGIVVFPLLAWGTVQDSDLEVLFHAF